MQIVKYLMGGTLCIFGLWIMILNGCVCWLTFVRRVRAPSWTPLLGGTSACIGLVFIGIAQWCWLPFLIDWGCIPGFTYTLWWFIRRR